MIIFCGHFPEGTAEFSQEETANETSGEWYLRQMLGSANLTGGKLFHHFRLALPGRGGETTAVHEAESNGRALAAGADGRASTAQGRTAVSG